MRKPGKRVLFRRNKKTGKLRRAGRPRRRGVKVYGSISPIPARQIVKMKYATAAEFNVVTAYNYQFNLNSIFDPDRTAGGHQPYGHDQLAALYNRYRVISCNYVLSAYTGSSPIRFGVVPANEVKTFTTVADLIENPRAQYRFQVPGGDTQVITGKCYIPSLMGRSKTQYMSDDRYQAAFGSSPAELAILNCTALSLAEVGVTVQFQLTLEYTVEVFDQHPLAQS